MRTSGRMLNSCVAGGLLLVAIVFTNLQCAISGSIIDRGKFETKLTDMRLSADGMLKVYHGGSRREIPLKQISSVELNPSITIAVDNELYFSADISLKDGTRLHSLDKDQTKSTRVFVSVQNSLFGRNAEERFVIRLHEVTRITVD